MGLDIFTEEAASRFWDEQRRRVENAECGETIDFCDLAFPEDPQDKYFHGIHFVALADFSGARFETGYVFENVIFHNDLKLDNAVFKEDTGFDIVFEADASFIETIFSGQVNFYSEFKGNATFQNAIFKDYASFGSMFADGPSKCIFKKGAVFDNAKFENVVTFRDTQFCANTSFRDTEFKYWTNFNNVRFEGRTDFQYAKFEKYEGLETKRRNFVQFEKVIFADKVDFRGCIFRCKARFQKVLFENTGEFRQAKFHENTEFIDVKANGRLFLERNYKALFTNSEDAIIPYRLAKLSTTATGDLRWAGYYHYEEQCAINCQQLKIAEWRPWKKAFYNWYRFGPLLLGEWLIGRWLFGYGEKPLRPLAGGAGVIIICAVLFCVFGGIKNDPNCSFWNCTYFSIVTFTTLGFGDFVPIASMRWLSATEAIFGAALMSLFIVNLARKFSR